MPRTAVGIEVVKQAVSLACRAPSVHNSQPWRWRWISERNMLRLFVDRRRQVFGADRSGREAIISCGAVLDHLRVAMAAAGWLATIDRFPNPNDADLLASIVFTATSSVTEMQRRCAEAMLQRRTDRLPLGRPTYWASFEPVLRSSLDDSVVMLDVLSDDVRPQLTQASQLSEMVRADDTFYHLELAWWTSPFALYEGVPPDALPSASDQLRVDVARQFPARGHGGRRPEVVVDWSKILVLSTAADTRTDVLRCGEALSTVLLESTMAGLATCTLTHLIEMDVSRGIVQGLIAGGGEPQVLIRVGIAPPTEELPAATPRRPLADVLELR